MAIVKITDVLAMGRTLLLDPSRAPIVSSQSPDVGSSTLMDVRIAGEDVETGTQGWLPGTTGLPWGVLSATRSDKSYKVSGRVDSDWTAYLHIALANQLDGRTQLHTWAYDWESALEQWFPQYYRLAELGQNGVVGDLWWKYIASDVGIFVMSGVSYFGVVCKLHIHYVNSISWNV